jgi:diguanylate cyclase (GGDEF)-like protein
MNQQLLERVLESPRLPSLPTIALEVIDLVQQPDVNIKQIANTIRHDPALASKLLKTVNSSFYGQTQTVSTISHALVVLGLNSVRTLALGFSLVANLKGCGTAGFDHVYFWKRSLYSATAARQVCAEINLPHQEEAFLGGLLQDLGMLALNQVLGDRYTDLVAESAGDHDKLLELERHYIDLDHPYVGAALGQSWNLPELLLTPIRYHETPEQVTGEQARMVQCVALGNLAAGIFVSESPGEAMEQFQLKARQWFDITNDRLDPLLRQIHTHTKEMRRLFDLPTGELGNPDEILARANEALMNITLQNQQLNNQLEAQNRELTQRVNIDSLTGVANRGRFNEFVTDQFDHARQHDTPLSVLFLDTDHFKHFNDTYGHPIGDQVLMELASLLSEHLPDNALIARYGGEEFAAVLPATPRREAARLAEAARRAAARRPVETDDGEALTVTVSIGVATLTAGCFTTPQQLVKAADQGVYAAKEAGRNAVRIFTPKPSAAAPPVPSGDWLSRA